MANKYKKINEEELIQLAEEYLNECRLSTKEMLSNKGDIMKLKDRMIPTVKYFVLTWLMDKGFSFYDRAYVYEILDNKEHPLSNTIKKVIENFDALAENIVANEGKGIFYAKNRLGMTDKLATDNINREQPLFKEEENE